MSTSTPAGAEGIVAWLRKQPLIAMLIVLEAPIIGTLVASYVADAPEEPKVLSTILAPLAGVLVFAARAAVTPVANPKANDGTPLIPVDAAEPGMPRRPTL